jgi:hypothetical protein
MGLKGWHGFLYWFAALHAAIQRVIGYAFIKIVGGNNLSVYVFIASLGFICACKYGDFCAALALVVNYRHCACL